MKPQLPSFVNFIAEKYEYEGIVLKLTSSSCPEQYDAFDSDGKQVGYLRLRHGDFRADVPACGGTTVYEAFPRGDGAFYEDERDGYLQEAIKAIKSS